MLSDAKYVPMIQKGNDVAKTSQQVQNRPLRICSSFISGKPLHFYVEMTRLFKCGVWRNNA